MKVADPLNFIDTNADWLKFNTTVSDNTGKVYRKLWMNNSAKNRKRCLKDGWAAQDLQDKHAGKTAVMLGASPAIKKHLDKLRELRNNEDFVLVGITSGLKNMIKNGIYPHYCMIADADPEMARFWSGLDMEKTKGITLLANICTHPSLVAKWKGPVKWIAIYTAIEELDKQIKRLYGNVNGCNEMFAALSSQYNIGAAIAYLILGCKIQIFVGNELSFVDKEVPYYPDRKDRKDKWDRFPHPDIRGKVAYTNFMLFALKLALEDFLGKLSGDGWFFNATEAGIFGVSQRYGNVPWIWQFTLDMAVYQAKSIMTTGKPLYAPEPLIYSGGK